MAGDTRENVAAPIELEGAPLSGWIAKAFKTSEGVPYEAVHIGLYEGVVYSLVPPKYENAPNPLLKAAEDRKKLRDDKKDVQPMVEDPLKEFDEGVAGLTERRGDIYGHPQDDFDRIIQIQKALDDCEDPFAQHIMNMIAVKMSRLVKTPAHADSWIDIVGYVRTWFMIQERRKKDV